ncbi:MAG: ATP-binding protein [Pseudomonadota bacterium]
METSDWILLLISALSLLAVAAVCLFGDVSDLRRLRRLKREVGAADCPALLARFSGRALLANLPMKALTGASARTVEAQLGPALAELDAVAVYRISQTARDIGFATMPVTVVGSDEPRHLAVSRPLDDLLVWRILTSAELARVLPAIITSNYEHAPFAHVRRGGGAEAVSNALFRRMFGPDPGAIHAALPEDIGRQGQKVLLAARDGRVHSFQAFHRCSELTAEQVSGPEDDLFLFPIPGDAPREDRLLSVLERMPVALAQFEPGGTLLWCNRLAREILGAHAEEGHSLESMFLPLGQPLRATEPAEEAMLPFRGQMVQLRGSDTFLQVSLTRMRVNDREANLAVLTDASQLRQLEDQFAQSQKMEAVGKLAGGVAHDFNNVLTAIVGHCDLLLLRKDASHPDYSDLIQITQNANRAAALVRQLLAFSRKQTLNPEVLSVQDVVSETHYLLNRLLGEAVALHLEIGRDLWSVRADHQQLEQVLMNLVVNARDAMAGSGRVTVAVRNVSLQADPGQPDTQGPDGDFVEICVRDTGPGIDPTVIDKVFDPFFTTKPKGEGTGLGLSTVYGIVHQSGGFIFAENAADGGARFRILLPRAGDLQETQPQLTRAPVTRRDLTGKGSVLLVEDEDPVRAFAARALKLRGYEVVEAATAEEAMEILEDEDYMVDLLVSDVVMPGMDGPTFASLARKMRPGLRLIFVSGYAEESFRKNLTETDFMFLAKPFSLNELTGKVKEALGDEPAD